MKKLYFIFIATLSLGVVRADCEIISCFDPCTHDHVQMTGDKCSVTWNEAKGCFQAYTECEQSKKCLGAYCYDGCTQRYRYFKTGNTCQNVFDPAQFCWSVRSICE